MQAMKCRRSLFPVTVSGRDIGDGSVSFRGHRGSGRYLVSEGELTSFLTALGSVVMIDIVLSADNAIVIGLAASNLPAHLRRRAIVIGIALAAVARVVFAIFTYYLLEVIGLLLAGGLLLAWVAWKMWREVREQSRLQREGRDDSGDQAEIIQHSTLGKALVAIIIADVTMSLDNVLGVAGAAQDHVEVLIFGLALSIFLMGVASNFLAKLMNTHHWIAYVGILTIAYVSLSMIWRGYQQVAAIL